MDSGERRAWISASTVFGAPVEFHLSAAPFLQVDASAVSAAMTAALSVVAQEEEVAGSAAWTTQLLQLVLPLEVSKLAVWATQLVLSLYVPKLVIGAAHLLRLFPRARFL